MTQPADIGALTGRDVDLEAYSRLLRDRAVGGPPPDDAADEYRVQKGAQDAASAERERSQQYDRAVSQRALENADRGALETANSPDAISAPGAELTDPGAAERAALGKQKTEQANVQSQGQRASAAQAALSGAYDRVLGRSGAAIVGKVPSQWIPSTRQQQGQRESTEMPPGYLDVASEELRQRGIAGAGQVQQEMGALDLARQNAQAEGEIRRIHSWAAEQANAEEDRALHGAQDKLDSIFTEFKNSGPKMRTYADIWNNSSGAQNVMQVFGMIFGSLGSMQKGRTNAFLDKLDNTIQRQAEIEEKQSEKIGRALGYAQNAYGVLRQRFRDRSVARDAYHALALDAFRQSVAEKANALGLSSGDARLAQVNAELLERQRSIMEKLSSKVLSQESEAQKFMPAHVVMAQANAMKPEALEAAVKQYEDDRLKAELPQKTAAIDDLKQTAAEMTPSDESMFQDLLRRKALADPNSWSELIARSKNPQLMQRLLEGVNTVVQSAGGKSLTTNEGQRYAASTVGDGSKHGIELGLEGEQRKVDKIEESLHAGNEVGYLFGNLRRKVYSNINQPHETEGVAKAPEYRKNVLPYSTAPAAVAAKPRAKAQ